jgi:hypothetical protein
MVYNTQNDWVYGFFLRSEFYIIRKHSISETLSVSFFNEGRKTPILLGLLERTSFNPWTSDWDPRE